MTEKESNQQERASPMGGDYLMELIKSVGGDSQNHGEEASPHVAAPVSASPSAFSSADLISSLLSNPELISKLPTIISTVKPILEMLGNASKSQATESITTVATPQQSNNTSHNRDRRAELLCAMKPYLSHDRCEAIDYIIKLSRLGDILKTL